MILQTIISKVRTQRFLKVRAHGDEQITKIGLAGACRQDLALHYHNKRI